MHVLVKCGSAVRVLGGVCGCAWTLADVLEEVEPGAVVLLDDGLVSRPCAPASTMLLPDRSPEPASADMISADINWHELVRSLSGAYKELIG